MGKYQAYPMYKDSGIRWVDRIPSTWSTTPIKSIAKIVNGATPKSGVEEFWDGDVAWITPADMGKQPTPYINSGARNITVKGYESCGTSLVPTGAIVLSARAPIGSLAIALNKLCTNQGCKSLIPTEKIHNKFLYYVLKSSTEQLNVLGRGTTFLELSADELGCFSFSLPPIEEQSIIANFLDHETAKIDTLIEKQQQLIQLLKEKRQAVISHAVTKGLNPNAPMKDSGVEWLGEVPEHWEILPLKHACGLIKDGTHLPPPRVDIGIPLLSVRNIIDGKFVFREDDSNISEYDYDVLCKSFIPAMNDVVLAIVGATLGKVALIESMTPFHVQRSVAIFRTKLDKLLPLTLKNIFDSRGFQSLLWEYVGFSAQPGIYLGTLENFQIAVAPPDEQLQINAYCSTQAGAIDKLINQGQKAIELMQERRTALISAAVTGKIDVRHFVVEEGQAEKAQEVV
jgi:type I restriction enzyme, S subunit